MCNFREGGKKGGRETGRKKKKKKRQRDEKVEEVEKRLLGENKTVGTWMKMEAGRNPVEMGREG